MAEEPITPDPVRGRGRPKGRVVSEERTSVSIWIPVSAHQRLTRLAKRQYDGNLAEAIRQKLGVKLR